MRLAFPRILAAATIALTLAALVLDPPDADSACCYFSAQGMDILQPAQKAFLTYDPVEKIETFTVQPKFEGNALDFGMVIPTPSQPKLDPAPRDFFQHLAVFTLLKKRMHPKSNLVKTVGRGGRGRGGGKGKGGAGPGDPDWPDDPVPSVRVLQSGVVGSLEYKVIEARRADDLYQWLKDNKYKYGGDEATLDFYVKKGWLFTVMKIDTAQMKRNADGSFSGDVTPTRFRFTSEQFVYPLKITQISVKDKTEALFYVQAPYKTDLPGDSTYQFQWIPMLQNAKGWYNKGTFGSRDLPGNGDSWLNAIGGGAQTLQLLDRGRQLGFTFVAGQRPQTTAQGRTATTLEWARKISADDIGLLKGEVAFSDKVPDPDEGFTQADMQDPMRRTQATQTIRQRLSMYRQQRPGGFLVREAPEADVKALRQLLGHVQEGQFLTKFRKVFTRSEMTDDLIIFPAKLGIVEDRSEYTEILPTSPP